MAAAVLVVGLIGVRLALPHYLLNAINEQARELGDYRGHIKDIDIHLWRGAYSIRDMTIEKASGKVPVPLLRAPLIDISVSWSALFDGGVVARVHFVNPELTLVDGRGDADSQSGRGVDWRSQLQRLMPITLDEVRITRGTVNFRNFISTPPVDLHATAVEATIENLTNTRGQPGSRPALLEATANLLKDVPLTAKSHFDPFDDMNNFDFDVEVHHIQLTQLNPLFQAYAKLDAESGAGEIVVQMDAREGRVRGYIKPLFHDIKVVNLKEDIKHPLKLIWETIAGSLAAIFKNHQTDQLATRINFEGPVKGPNVDTLNAIAGILRNAFIKALLPGFEKLQKDDSLKPPKNPEQPKKQPATTKKLPEVRKMP